MSRRLPARPNLEHLRAQAKALLLKLREGDADAVQTFAEFLPEAAKLSKKQILTRGFRLADAQGAIARKSGFAAWPGLARHVERLRSMEGKWAFRSLEIDGQTIPSEMLTASFLLIDGDRFRMESPEANYEGVFVIDVERTPHGIDIDFVEGPEAGERCEGLFELDGDRFRLCLGLVGSKRPDGFVTSAGSGHALEDLVRVEAARPVGVEGGKAPVAAEADSKAPAGDASEFGAVSTATHERLQGEWLPLELVTSGVPLQESYLPFGVRVQAGLETKVVFGGQSMVHALMRIEEGAAPIAIDYFNLAGKSKGVISRGVFRWEGEDAVFCMGKAGDPRPADFSCLKGSGRTFSRWKRNG